MSVRTLLGLGALVLALAACPSEPHRPSQPSDTSADPALDAADSVVSDLTPEEVADASDTVADVDVKGPIDSSVDTPVDASPDTPPDVPAIADDGGVTADDGGVSVDDGPPPTGDPIAVAVGYGARRVMSVDGETWENFIEGSEAKEMAVIARRPRGGDARHRRRSGERSERTNAASMAISEAAASKVRLFWV